MKWTLLSVVGWTTGLAVGQSYCLQDRLDFVAGSDLTDVIETADFDGDGYLDIVTATSGILNQSPGGGFFPGVIQLHFGFAGWFAGPVSIGVLHPLSSGSDPTEVRRYIATGDVDGDGDSDIITDSGDTLLNNGQGFFAIVTSMQNHDRFGPVALADLNGDGSLDRIMYEDSFRLRVNLNPGDGFWGDDDFTDASGNPSIPRRTIVTGDFNGDGRDDAVIPTGSSSEYHLLWIDATGEIRYERFSTGGPPSIAARDCDAADFDADGDLDVLVTSDATISNVGTWLYRNDGTGRFTKEQITGTSGLCVSALDFNADGFPDFAFGYQASLGRYYLNDGTGDFLPSQSFSPGWSPEGSVTGDFDGDGDEDLAVLNRYGGTFSVFWNASGQCIVDLNRDCSVDFADVTDFLTGFSGSEAIADLAAPFGEWDFSDVIVFLGAFAGGCP